MNANKTGKISDWCGALPFEPACALLDRLQGRPLARLVVMLAWVVLMPVLLAVGIIGGGLFAFMALIEAAIRD